MPQKTYPHIISRLIIAGYDSLSPTYILQKMSPEEHRLFCALEKFRYGLLFDGSTNFQLTHNLQLLKFVLKMRRKYRAKNKMEVSQ